MLEKLWLKIQPYGFQSFLSYLAGKLAFCETPWLKDHLIRKFMRKYPNIDYTQATVTDPLAYPSFMALFARTLKPEARPLPRDPRKIAAPCDGRLMQKGRIEKDTLLFAKGDAYTVPSLLGGPIAPALFAEGSYAVFYLAPDDYHRVHMPTDGHLRQMTYVPGNLFSVQPHIVDQMPDLFTRNTRVSVLFETPFGPMAVIFIAAFLVGGVHTPWAGAVSAVRPKTWQYPNTPDNHIQMRQGDECGYFYFGSSVILLLPKGAQLSGNLTPTTHYKMGTILGQMG